MTTSRVVFGASGWAACVVAVAHVPSALAASLDLATEADVRFELGVEAQQARDYTTAIAHYLVSQRLSPNKNVLFNVATCFERLERYPEAFRYFQQFLEEKIEADERRLAEAALARIRPQVGLLSVATEPPGATIYLQRKDLGSVGSAPRVLAVKPGRLRVIVEAEGHRPAVSDEIAVRVGEEKRIQLTLERILGHVQVAGDPEGAIVRLEGPDGTSEEVGKLPSTIALVPGHRVLLVEAPGRKRARYEIDVAEAVTSRLEVILAPETGSILVDADEMGTLIELDGRPVGFTPTVLAAVPSGAHTVRVSRSGFVPYEREVLVPVDGEVTVSAELSPSSDVTAASRVTQRAEDAPASVSLISAEELRAFAYQTVWEALGGQRGIYQTDDRTYASLGFRGFSQPQDYGNRVLVMIDGHAMNDDLLGSSYTHYDFHADLLDVERIELVRGPGSVLYGTNAFFGVINLVTRGADSLPPPHVSVAAEGVRMARVRAGAGFELGENAGVWLSAGGVLSQGDDLFLKDVDGGTNVRSADGFYTASAAARAWWGDVTLAASFNKRDKRIPTGAFETLLGDPRNHSDDTRGYFEARWEPQLGDWATLHVRAFLDTYSLRGGYPYGPEDGEPGTVLIDAWDGMWAGGEVRADLQPFSFLRVTAGVDGKGSLLADLRSTYRNDDGTSDQVLSEDASVYSVAGYALASVRPWDLLAVDVGLRYDFASTFADGAFSPRAAIVLHPWEGGTFKLLGGTAFRAPSVYELRYHDGGFTQVPPDSLQPETIYTGELEVSQRFGDVTLTAAGYVNRIHNLVTTEDVDVDDDGIDDVFRYANAPDIAHTVGGEVEARRELRHGWMVAATYSYQRTRVGDFLSDAEDALVPNSPEHLASVRGVVPLVRGIASLSGRLRFEAPRLGTRVLEDGSTTFVENKAAFLCDLTLTGEVRAYHLEWGIGVRNLFDWRVRHPAGTDIAYPFVPQVGRTFFLQLTMSM